MITSLYYSYNIIQITNILGTLEKFKIVQFKEHAKILKLSNNMHTCIFFEMKYFFYKTVKKNKIK